MVQEPTLLLNFIAPVCSLISLYNGPNLSEQEFWRDEKNQYIAQGSKNNFNFKFLTDVNHSQFNYYNSGIELVRIEMNVSGEAAIYIDQKLSTSVLLELIKLIEAEKKIRQAQDLVEQATQIPEPIQFNIPFANDSEMESKFIQKLNSICRLISQNCSPSFGPEDLIIEERRSIGEVFTYLDKSNELYTIAYQSSVYETGHWSGSKGGHHQFLMTRQNQTVLQAGISGMEAKFEIAADLEIFIPQIKTNPAPFI